MAYDYDSLSHDELVRIYQSADNERKILSGLERFANNGMVLFAIYGAVQIPKILATDSSTPAFVAAGAMVVTAALGGLRGYTDELLFDNDAHLMDLQTRIEGKIGE